MDVKIYNLKGQMIKTLNILNGSKVLWDLTDRNGKGVGSGLYLYKVYEGDNLKNIDKLLIF
jgi:hypothetical protein